MTKKPTPPAQPNVAKAKKDKTTPKTNEQRFWEYMLVIQKDISQKDFGVGKGKGGSQLKDSHALHHYVRERFIEDGVTFDLIPTDVQMIPVEHGFAVHGKYTAKFFFNGELVYETIAFGSFDTGNSAQATHGSYTAARTSLLFNITQASVMSQEKVEEQRQQEINRQAPRQPVGSGAAPY